MSGQVDARGNVNPPLNIAAPAPAVNLKGFRWQTVDQKILGEREAHRQLDGQLERSLLATGEPDLRGFPLTKFEGAYAGNGFNTIWRPRGLNDPTFVDGTGAKTAQDGDNTLQLNLITEQMTFGETIGEIPNRGLGMNGQKDITLHGFPYLQTIQDVTNPDTGLGDHLLPTGIHFEPGMFLNVPACDTIPKIGASVVRMASIPHGTTINAQGLVPVAPNLSTSKAPDFDAAENIVDTTPFSILDDPSDPSKRMTSAFQFQMTANQDPFPTKNSSLPARIPQDLSLFNKKGTITSAIIKNPNLVLKNAIKGQTITETVSFTLATGCAPPPPPPSTAKTTMSMGGSAQFNGGGTTNISFLAGTQGITTEAPVNPQKDTPNAHAHVMTAKYWIETVQYTVRVPKVNTPGIILLRPDMPKDCTAPTPVFAITTPSEGVKEETTITVPGIQIQSSQVVNLNFGPLKFKTILTWPHVSVSTLVPVDPQPFTMAEPVKKN